VRVKRARSHTKKKSFRYGIAAVALCAGLAGAPTGVAWADPGTADSTQSATTGPADRASAERAEPDKPTAADNSVTDSPDSHASATTAAEDEQTGPGSPDADPDLDIRDTEAEDPVEVPELPEEAEGGDVPEPAQPTETTSEFPVIPESDVPGGEPSAGRDTAPKAEPVRAAPKAEPVRAAPKAEPVRTGPVTKAVRAVDEAGSGSVATLTPPAELMTVTVPRTQRELTDLAAAVRTDATAPAVAAINPAVEPAAPTPPQPLSPIAELLELPGRLVNAVLDALDFTSTASSPNLPISLQPVNDAIFGAFRELERQLGLWRTPAPQPVVPTLTYDGPTTRPTPTVAQFLNASTSGYVLGSTPGGLVPFTVDGFQMSSTNVFSGMVGKVWATPEGQLIISYQGTTGGSNLLFNPLITVAQVLADLQVVFTGTTPLAFHDALDFAEQVRAEAALQGYSEEDIFVTGHSLGGWEAQYVAQQTGLAGIGFEAPGINTIVPGNGADSMFVNIGTYGSSAPYMATDLPGLQPFMPPFVPGGGSKPHYGPIVMIGDPAAMTPLYNASALWGTSVTGSVIFLVDYLMNFFQYHLPGVQAYHLDVTPDPGVVLFLGTRRGPVHTGYGTLTIPELMKAASDDGILFRP
jgi:hypothetical protein